MEHLRNRKQFRDGTVNLTTLWPFATVRTAECYAVSCQAVLMQSVPSAGRNIT
jgi:hypothetical protein